MGPHPHMAGMRVVLLVEAQAFPATEVCYKPSNQIVSELGAVDYRDEEAVRDSIERLRDVHRYGFCSAMGLTLVETRDHPSRNGEQSRGGGVPRLEAGREEEPLQYLHCRAELRDGVVGAALVSWLLCLQNRDYDGVLPNCRYVNSGN